MNHDCNGDRFIADGQPLYRCLAGGNVTESVPNGQQCPACMRQVDARDHGILPVSAETTHFVTLDGGRRGVIWRAVGAASTGVPESPSPRTATPAGRRKGNSEWPERLRHLALLVVVVSISYYAGTHTMSFLSTGANPSPIAAGPVSTSAHVHPLLTEAEVDGLIDLSPIAVRQCVREKVINEVAKSPAPSEPRDRGTSGLTRLTVPQITVIRRLCHERQSN